MSEPVPASPGAPAGPPPPPAGVPARPAWRAWWIAGGYAVVASLWIAFSDRALEALVPDPALLVEWSMVKGLAFVGVTALLLWFVLRRAFHANAAAYAALAAHQDEIERLRRLYAALSQVNQAIVWTKSRDELLPRVCRALVEFGGFRLAWIGWHDSTTRRLVPVAAFGDGREELQRAIVRTDDQPEGGGPSGRAFRDGRPHVSNDFLHDPTTRPWWDTARRRGVRASASFPIRVHDDVEAVLSVFADETGFFQDAEIALLTEAATDISFALDNQAGEEERRRAEARAENEQRFSATMIESMPGILYFYDSEGRFLRWNRNFEQVSGYSREEIARMHPREFFAPEDRPLVEARIGEVFTTGESSVEAPFRTRDGATIPYFFTGRRVEFDGRPCLVGVGVDIADRKRAEAALRRSEERLRRTLDGVLEGCQLLDHDGRYLYLNDVAAHHNRRPNAELIGRTMPECWPGIEQTSVFATIQRCLEERIPGQEEVEFVFPDGSRGWFDVRAEPAEEGVLILSIDRTERKLAEERLIASEREYRELVELANSIILRWDAQGRVTLLNEFGQRFFGYSAEEILGRSVIGTIVPETESSGRDLQRLMDEVCADPAAFEQNTNENMRRNGERVWIAWTNRIVRDAQGKVVEILSIGTDITEQRRAEQAIRELNLTLEHKVTKRTEELQAALVRAEAADRLKSAFLATMSHELRTPLNSIIGFTGIVLQGMAGPLTPEQQKQLGMVRNSARHLLELINDVLDISKIEAGQLDIRAEPFDVPPVVERAVATVQPLADKKSLRLSAQVAPELGRMVNDRRRLEQMLLNLLNNAVKFTDEGAVTLTADVVAEHRFTPDGPPVPVARFAVTDTGIGIRAQDLATLFQPFRQIETGLERPHEGTGLGLAICRRLAGLMGGEITAASTPSQGSTFTLLLPLHHPSIPCAAPFS